MRKQFFIFGIIILFLSSIIAYYYRYSIFFPLTIFAVILIGFANSIQTKHAILRNFPVLGYFRYLFEMIAPEIQQYFTKKHIGVEIMTTGAACRTYNVLLAEGRNVAAALVLV